MVTAVGAAHRAKDALGGGRIKSHSKRTKDDDARFEAAFEELLAEIE